ncbi:tetratricopeptide repeat protein [Gemmatimonadota bacterium]
MKRPRVSLLLSASKLSASALLVMALACGEASDTGLPGGAQAISLRGDTLFAPEAEEAVQTQRRLELEEALADLEAEPESAEALIWAGRRYAYLGEYRQAIELFTEGAERFPSDARFLRHRGHRFITVRELDHAIGDFSRAAELTRGQPDEIEPDGQPNARGIPTSTLQFNIWYHYGLAHYLKGEFEEALEKYRECMAVSKNQDSRVATAHWLYMTLRRLGREDEALEVVESIDFGEEVIESGSYLDLLRLYAGGLDPRESTPGLENASLEGATVGYGVGNWYFYNGDSEAAERTFRQVLEARDQWASFGYIAAEAEVARMEGGA